MSELRPDPEHDAVLACTARHQVVVAPPGTGKTCLSVRLAARLASELPLHARVLLLTFSTQARTQLEREAARRLPPGVRRRIEITNYHRFFWNAVCAYRRALGLPMQLDLGSRKRRESALARVDLQLVRRLTRTEGLIESLAEHQFPEFRDNRTPGEPMLRELLAMVEREQRAGRLVFDDLGALFWRLLEQFTAVAQAYRDRYPVVIADEHQDASALQDAVVRRLGQARLVIFADPMQLIHGFRGASPARLACHLDQAEAVLSLTTPHRWHGREATARWLLAVRSRLQGHAAASEVPADIRVTSTPAGRGLSPMKAAAKISILRAFRGGLRSVAVLARKNSEVGELRRYFSRQGMHPRQIGTEDFEDARTDIEKIPSLRDSVSLASLAVERIESLVPTLSAQVINQVRSRLGVIAVNLRGSGREARCLLQALEPLYTLGPTHYVHCVVDALNVCAEAGHHLPRISAVRALRGAAEALGENVAGVDAALACYAERVMVATHIGVRTERGLFVMTAHQAKGKEFDVVVLVNASTRFWPDEDETRRLFYVVITRATSRLEIIAPDRQASPLLHHLTGE